MAKTAYAIQMDFKKAKSQAEKLERIARDIDKIANNDMSFCMRNVSVSWKGANAQAYAAKGEKIAETLHAVSGGISKTASVVGRIAQTTLLAEEKSLELAKNRGYGQ